MISENDAICRKHLTLSKDDPKINDLAYRIGDVFIHQCFDNDWDPDLINVLSKHNEPIIVKIDSLLVTIDAEIGYRVSFVSPKFNPDWKWYVTEDMLNENFSPIKGVKDFRFYMLE